MPKFTEEQQLAIDLEGSNILVSAGAGSGKTAVLTERVLRKIKTGIHINELLILTFTNKAALEMKERIRKKLKDNNMLSELDLLDSSYITTFDAYSLALVKKYADIMHLSKNINIAEASILELAKKEILDEIFLEYYEKRPKDFCNLIIKFCLKDDSTIKKRIIELDNTLELKLNKEEFINTYITMYYNENVIEGYIDDYLRLLNNKKNDIINLYEELRSLTSGKYLEQLEELFKLFLESNTYEELRNNIIVSLPKARSGVDSDSKEIRDNLVALLKEFKDLLIYESLDDIKNSIIKTKDYIYIILKLVNELNKRFNKYKLDNNYYTFMDIEKLAINLVKENKEVREEVKKSFNEILIDEYQDTNDIQEEFISYIANNNVYMVGDIKQSIYRFRNANPSIFKDKYDNYKRNIGGHVIDLAKNFRSRKEVLEDINLFFSHIMDDFLGGASYNEGHAMIFGNMTYQEKAKVKSNNYLEIYTYGDKDKLYSKLEKEAFIIASDIKEKINSKYLVYDKDLDILREIEYRDFVILLDRATDFTTYKQIFEYLHLPITLYEDEKTSGSTDLALLKNIFIMARSIITNNFDTKFKLAFTSLARSFLFSYSDEEIYKCLVNNTYKDSSVFNLFKEILSNYEILTPIIYLEKVLEKLDYTSKLVFIGNVDIMSSRMEYFYNLIINLENSNYTILDVSDYLEKISNEKLEIKLAISKEDSNSIKIMTIHKSKGLEYPICYFAGFYKDFNKDEYKSNVLFDNKYGIIIDEVDSSNKLITKTLALEKLREADISEKIRLLYVALTRAREKMIIVMPNISNDKELGDIVNNFERLNYSNFAKMVNSVYSLFRDKIKEIDNIKDISKAYLEVKRVVSKNNFDSQNCLGIVPSIYDKTVIEKETYHKESLLEKSDVELKLLEIGRNVHTLFERIDFNNNKLPFIEGNYYKQKLNKFLNSEFMLKYKDYKKYQEYEFIYTKSNKIYHGKIDLLLVGDSNAIIIDYKLKNTKDNDYFNQLNGYKEVIEKKLGKPTSCYLYSIIDEIFVNICPF